MWNLPGTNGPLIPCHIFSLIGSGLWVYGPLSLNLENCDFYRKWKLNHTKLLLKWLTKTDYVCYFTSNTTNYIGTKFDGDRYLGSAVSSHSAWGLRRFWCIFESEGTLLVAFKMHRFQTTGNGFSLHFYEEILKFSFCSYIIVRVQAIEDHHN